MTWKLTGLDIRIKHATFERFLRELQDRDLPYSAETGYFEYHFGDGKKALVDETTALQNMLKTAGREAEVRAGVVGREDSAEGRTLPPVGDMFASKICWMM